MNRLVAKRDFRHGNRRIKVGEEFQASPIDTEYYRNFGYADAVEGTEIVAPTSRRAYSRKDMQAEDMRAAVMTTTGRTAVTHESEAERQAKDAAKETTRRTRARVMTTGDLAGAAAPSAPMAPAAPPAAPSAPAAPVAPQAPQVPKPPPSAPAPAAAPSSVQQPDAPTPPVSGGEGNGVVSSATGTAAGQSNQ